MKSYHTTHKSYIQLHSLLWNKRIQTHKNIQYWKFKISSTYKHKTASKDSEIRFSTRFYFSLILLLFIERQMTTLKWLSLLVRFYFYFKWKFSFSFHSIIVHGKWLYFTFIPYLAWLAWINVIRLSFDSVESGEKWKN
jgi:membrane-associated protease RseP (regulator of RpoE activity)